MSGQTAIEWTDRTWNPLTGCTKVSPGCDHCYAKTMHERFNGPGSFDTVTLHPDRLDQPLRWRKPTRVFVNSMSDLFHDSVPDEYIARVFATMALAPQHTFQILTKRHARMRSLLSNREFPVEAWRAACDLRGSGDYAVGYERILMRDRWPGPACWPLPNVWLGVSVENQQWADIRIPALLDTPAAVQFLSCEPLLGPVDLSEFLPEFCGCETCFYNCPSPVAPGIDWVIVGGESGVGARPMHPHWAYSLRDQCAAAGIPFLFKQWGAYDELGRHLSKKLAGRILDGRTWDEYPTAATA